MKIYLKTMIVMLSLGWIPLLIFWGRKIGPLPDPVELIVFIACISVLATSWIILIVILQDDLFWKSIKELQFLQTEFTKAIAQKNREIDLYMRKCKELAEKIITFDNENIMRKVLFKKWIPREMVVLTDRHNSPYHTNKPGTACWEPEFTHEGLFHQWGNAYEEGDNGFGNHSIALIELPDGTMEEVLPTNIQFID
jgi:hypothetical protein